MARLQVSVLKLDVYDVSILTTSVRIIDWARDLGVVIDNWLTKSDHGTAVCHSVYSQLRQLHVITRSFSDNVAWPSACSLCKTPQRGWPLWLVGKTTSHRYWDSFTVVCEAMNWLKSRSTGVQVSSWPHHTVSVGQLPTRHGGGTSTPPVSGCPHLRSPSDTHTARWFTVTTPGLRHD